MSDGIPQNLRIGTSSWSAEDWVGPFYPPGTLPADYLAHYSSQYDTVEVDSTFYRPPTPRMVDGWRRRTPEGFVFAAKVPRSITHDKALEDCGEEMAQFLEVMSRLEKKLGPLLLQFPYFARGRNPGEYETGEDFRGRLLRFLDRVPDGFRFALDVRNEKWLRPPLLETLRERGVALALLDYYTLPSIDRLIRSMDPLTTDFLYVRFLGNHRKMDEIVEARALKTGKRWNEIAVNRSTEGSLWVQALRDLCPRVKVAWAFVNNHYAGYAPGSIDLLRSLFAEPIERD